MTDIKFCGLRTRNDVWTAIDLRARWAGFVHSADHPDHMDPDDAAEAFRPALNVVEAVSVTYDAGDDLLSHVRADFAPEWIQLHGSESPARTAAVRRFAGKGVIKAIRVAGPEDLKAAEAYHGAADIILFDLQVPIRDDRAWPAAPKFSTPWILSGGLTADNVREAVALTGASAVSVSAGIEDMPGQKSAARMKAFASALRSSAPRPSAPA
ncbi:phosphoribosylanthranilate isomerase [Hyphobacterium sp. HN65]|uniref:N-(5'-phosphoribosyl)anthranilate isomerase n=1 Tax=Hyphobacterium lacteum TaxID=3116575 RepID=A0ABU7LSR4_9PROT|nr:phosphoribosylanthranilate isomerase [Hyphobacterium sp. HN65]MEE2526943.1 phosphoribosylanthranilate isomerase [Hyphobacterium sp. HN65]